MSEELKRILIEIIDENGWYAEREAALVAATVRETALSSSVYLGCTNSVLGFLSFGIRRVLRRQGGQKKGRAWV